MKNSKFFLILAAGILMSLSANADESSKPKVVYQTVQTVHNVPGIEFEKPQIFQVHKENQATSSKMTIHNSSDKELVITQFKCQGFARTELHNSRFINGEREMYEIKSITVPAHGKTVISPNRTHFMMFDPEREFKIGEYLTMELQTNLGTIPVIAEIVPRRLK
ncbi:MAG: hypothetical protein CSA45_00775 [Gammaproteobacteria bacterium]|nr:MAG: hypothetical protein CSA45_00775 [Gammaproteobacteria bacterium]